MGYNPNYQTEGHIYAQYILREKPNAKIAVLYQNDDFGRDYVTGLKEGLGRAASSMIVSEATYEVTDPTIDSQIIKLRASGADSSMTLPVKVRGADDQEGRRAKLVSRSRA